MSVDGDTAGEAGWRLNVAALVAAVAAAAIVALVFLLGQANRQRDAALATQEHSYEVMILARALDATMGRSEASLGRFVISGDKRLGRIYFDDWRRAGTLLDRLDTEIRDPASQRLIDTMRRAYAARGEELAGVALRTTYGQNAQALSKYYDAGNSPNVRRIETLLDRIIESERTILAQRTRAADATVARSNIVSMILSVFGVLLVIGAVVLGWIALQSFAQRRDDVRRTEALEDAVEERTAELSEANARLLSEMETREHAEAQLRQVQKMEAVGQLTGGIAHDFNNMLAVVIGGLEMAQRRLRPTEPATRHLENALEGANRAAALTKRLLAFARAEPLLPVATDANELIAGMSDLLDRTIGDTIAVRVVNGADLWPVSVDRHQLENALLNLAVNARDAMERGGTLTIATANVELSAEAGPAAEPGDYVRIAVSDTGIGMSRAVLARIFEPFFTTKPTGKGTGLGLSQIFAFVRDSGGTIAADSEVGTGTTISILLPRGVTAVEAISQRIAPLELVAHGGETILVVEDDRRVLAATVDALEELGHRPIPCPVAAEAERMIALRPEIGLIVSDVLMPGITGPDLIASIRATHGHLPVLFVTGFAGDIEEGEAFGGHEVLRKPFTIAALGQAVDRALAKARPAPAEAA